MSMASSATSTSSLAAFYYKYYYSYTLTLQGHFLHGVLWYFICESNLRLPQVRELCLNGRPHTVCPPTQYISTPHPSACDMYDVYVCRNSSLSAVYVHHAQLAPPQHALVLSLSPWPFWPSGHGASFPGPRSDLFTIVFLSVALAEAFTPSM